LQERRTLYKRLPSIVKQKYPVRKEAIKSIDFEEENRAGPSPGLFSGAGTPGRQENKI
jgi:hypothetical protein